MSVDVTAVTDVTGFLAAMRARKSYVARSSLIIAQRNCLPLDVR